MTKKIAAGIVTYNPDIDRLNENLGSIYSQVEKIFLVDNASENVRTVKRLLEKYPGCELVCNKKNLGVAKALNQILERAEQQSYDWMLTLDDDSVCDKDMVRKLMPYINHKKVGIVCPNALDDKMIRKSSVKLTGCEEIRDCITAGSLTNVRAWRDVGKFDEKMFIDFVDIEFCARLRENEYRILRVNGTNVHQQYGNIRGVFSIFGKKFYLFDYSPTRIYYSVRNQIYYMKRHHENTDLTYRIFFLIGYISKRILFEKKRIKSMQAVIFGIRDGVVMHE